VPKLTAAQVWYVTRVQPESVTPGEAQKVYDSVANKWNIDTSYWDASARVLSDLADDASEHLKTAMKRATEILKSTVEYGSLCTPAAGRNEILKLVKELEALCP
jgi:hypothetical protein